MSVGSNESDHQQREENFEHDFYAERNTTPFLYGDSVASQEASVSESVETGSNINDDLDPGMHFFLLCSIYYV